MLLMLGTASAYDQGNMECPRDPVGIWDSPCDFLVQKVEVEVGLVLKHTHTHTHTPMHKMQTSDLQCSFAVATDTRYDIQQ